MCYDLVVNTFVKDAIVRRRLDFHGGGWIWWPLVDVENLATFHVLALAAPLDLVSGQIFYVLEEDFHMRELAKLVVGSFLLVDPAIRVELERALQPTLVRNYRMRNAKLSASLDFTPSRTVL